MGILLGSIWRRVGLAPTRLEESCETGERIGDGFHCSGQLCDGKKCFLCEECTRAKRRLINCRGLKKCGVGTIMRTDSIEDQHTTEAGRLGVI